MSTRSSFGQKRTNAGTLKNLNALVPTSEGQLNIYRGEKYFDQMMERKIQHTHCKGKGKVNVHATKAYRGSRGMAPLILNLCNA